MRIKFALGWLVIGAVCCLTPMFSTPASGGWRCRGGGGGVCVQYVYIDRYIVVEKDREGRPPNPKTPQIHFLLVMDTQDVGVGGLIAETESRLRDFFETSIPANAQGKIRSVKRDQLTKSNVLSTLRDFAVASNDTLLVFCNVHGEATKDVGQKLYMDANAPEGEGFLLREELLQALAAKECRLKLLVTDSCFTSPDAEDFASARLVRRVEEGMKPKLPELRPNAETKKYVVNDLFLNHKGVLDMNSSSPPKGETPGEFAVATVFIDALLDLIEGNPDYRDRLTWQRFTDQLKGRTAERFKDTIEKPRFAITKKELTDLKPPQTSQTVYVFPDKAGATTYPEYAPVDKDVLRETAKESGEQPDGGTPAPGVPAPSAPRSESSESTSAEPASAEAASANIEIHVPADAQLFIDNDSFGQTDVIRRFRTLVIEPGQTRTYTLRAERLHEGNRVEQTKVVTVRGGENRVVKFDGLKASADVAGR